MAFCNVMPKSKEQRMDTMNKVWNYWLSKTNIAERFGGQTDHNHFNSAKNMKWFIEQRLEKPWDSDSPLTVKDYSRIKVEIDAFNKALGGKFSNLAFVVPEYISQQDPTSRRFYLKLNSILDYERTHINKVLTDNSTIAEHMLHAYMSEFGGKTDKATIELRRLRKEMIEGDPNEHTEAEFINKIENFVKRDKKFKESQIRFVLISQIGNATISKEITLDNIKESLRVL